MYQESMHHAVRQLLPLLPSHFADNVLQRGMLEDGLGKRLVHLGTRDRVIAALVKRIEENSTRGRLQRLGHHRMVFTQGLNELGNHDDARARLVEDVE